MGFTQVLNAKYDIDIDAAVAAYAYQIVASRGSVPHYGRVTVRGVEIDLDAVNMTVMKIAGLRKSIGMH
jgi:hypothetical protein